MAAECTKLTRSYLPIPHRWSVVFLNTELDIHHLIYPTPQSLRSGLMRIFGFSTSMARRRFVLYYSVYVQIGKDRGGVTR